LGIGWPNLGRPPTSSSRSGASDKEVPEEGEEVVGDELLLGEGARLGEVGLEGPGLEWEGHRSRPEWL
jgi:hypothetical protein